MSLYAYLLLWSCIIHFEALYLEVISNLAIISFTYKQTFHFWLHFNWFNFIYLTFLPHMISWYMLHYLYVKLVLNMVLIIHWYIFWSICHLLGANLQILGHLWSLYLRVIYFSKLVSNIEVIGAILFWAIDSLTLRHLYQYFLLQALITSQHFI